MRYVMLSAIVALGMALPYASAEDIQPNTVWENDRGSDLTITNISADGVLTGTFVNRARGFKCKNSPYPVSGYVYGDKIVFTVRWQNTSEDCASITTWAGFLSNGQLVADWMLVYTDPKLQHPFQMLGTDYFGLKTGSARRAPRVSE